MTEPLKPKALLVAQIALRMRQENPGRRALEYFFDALPIADRLYAETCAPAPVAPSSPGCRLHNPLKRTVK